MKPSSSTSDLPGDLRDGLFGGVYGSPAVNAATSDRAWLTALLDVERALALAAARIGLVPADAAAAVVEACETLDPDHLATRLAAGAADQATPVIALVSALREAVPDGARKAVHPAATSQDVVDTAAMLIAHRALGPVLADVVDLNGLLAALAREHRETPQVGRTLLQQGSPTTFGAVCATRLVGIDEAREGLAEVRSRRLAVQLGGPVGTLAGAQGRGPALVTGLADELGLAEPVTSWHTTRGRVAQLAAAAGVLAGELAGLAQDVVLLSAGEVAEVAEGTPGGSSAMPHKRNPAQAVLAVACAHRIPGLVATVLAGMPQELQRAAGRWQAEWGTLTDLLRLLGGTAHHTVHALTGLQVDTAAMLRHLAQLADVTGTAAFTEADIQAGAAVVDRALAAVEGR